MRVFVTGATGFIGSQVTRELIGAGHQVLGLTRSNAGAAALRAAGAEVHHGAIEDLDSLKAGAEQADGVIHLAFNHDFSRFKQNSEDDRRVIEAMGAVLAGSDRPMLITSGTAMANTSPAQPATEDGPTMTSATMPRAASEEAAVAAEANGAKVAVVRLPQVHDTRKQGLISYVIASAREKGVVAYVGDGAIRWPAAHVTDVARLYRLALEQAEAGARYHAVAEEGVSMRAICEAIGPRLGLPVRSIAPDEAAGFYGWLAMFLDHDMSASGAWTQQRLGWAPTGPTMIADLERLEVE